MKKPGRDVIMKLTTFFQNDALRHSSIFTTAMVALLVVTVSGFSAVASGNRSSFHGQIQPKIAKDVNPDPEIVEVFLVAHERKIRFGPGKRTKVWTYNGGIPGPTIHGNILSSLN